MVEIPLKNGLKGVKSVSDSSILSYGRKDWQKCFIVSVYASTEVKNIWLDLHRRPLVEIPLKRKRGVKEVKVISDALTSPSLHRKGRLKKIHQKTAKSKRSSWTDLHRRPLVEIPPQKRGKK